MNVKSLEDFLAERERECQSILFKGYTTGERDPAQLFRMMCNDARRIREVMTAIYRELTSPPTQPKAATNGVANGAAHHQPQKAK